MTDQHRYAAFISYSSKDARFAKRLHAALEHYRIPTSLGAFQLTGRGGKRNRVYPVFRDREELSAGELGERIEAGLRDAAALIVVCSPAAAASPWVQKEIEYFIQLGRRDRIFAVIADTAPLRDKSGRDVTADCFPPAFRGDALASGARTIEPLAADARRGKDGFRNAVLKLIAGLIGVTPGQIIDRDAQARRAARLRAVALATAALVAVGALYSQRAVLEPVAASLWRYKRFANSTESLQAAAPGATFQDCQSGSHDCPTMVVIPEGRFLMGAAEEGPDVDGAELPQREMRVERFAVSQTEITFDQWAACVAAGRCVGYPHQDDGRGYGRRAAVNLSWTDAQGYAAWLSDMTGFEYRLLSEVEWEYAARAGSTATYSWGDEDPNCDRTARNGAASAACNEHYPIEVAQFRPNAFGLYDMEGGVSEWIEDCFGFYLTERRDAAAVTSEMLQGEMGIDGQPPCTFRGLRGGDIADAGYAMRSAARGRLLPVERMYGLGFRVARTL